MRRGTDERLATAAALRPEGEETLVVARRISAAGRARAPSYGGVAVPAPTWRLIGELLVEVSSQHEARRLGRPRCSWRCWMRPRGHAEQVAAMESAWAALRARPRGTRRPSGAGARRGSPPRRAGGAGGAGGRGGARSRASASGCRRAAIACATSTSCLRVRRRAALVNPRGRRGGAEAGRPGGGGDRRGASGSTRRWRRWPATFGTPRMRLQEAAIDLPHAAGRPGGRPRRAGAGRGPAAAVRRARARFGAPVEELHRPRRRRPAMRWTRWPGASRGWRRLPRGSRRHEAAADVAAGRLSKATPGGGGAVRA